MMASNRLADLNRKSHFKPIFFGPEIWRTQKCGGISRYFQNLIYGTSLARSNTFAFIPNNDNEHVKLLPEKILIHASKETGPDLINQGLRRVTWDSSGGIYHSTFYGTVDYKLWRKLGYSNVITVHDLISEKFPSNRTINRPRINQKKRAIKFADQIICISNTTKKELLKFYDIPEHKISVIYQGCDFTEKFKSINSTQIKKDYLLFVGKRGWYKNFYRFIEAFSRSRYLQANFKIVAFGGGKFTQDEIKLFSLLNVDKKISWISGGDEKLAQLYYNAAALIYPSLDEGFGLPPLEAMSLGCPVIASNQGSIPEICGENAIYFDPYQLESISSTIENSLSNSELLRSNTISGKNHSMNFTWTRTINETNVLYSSLN